jgi:hypothetical protein
MPIDRAQLTCKLMTSEQGAECKDIYECHETSHFAAGSSGFRRSPEDELRLCAYSFNSSRRIVLSNQLVCTVNSY